MSAEEKSSDGQHHGVVAWAFGEATPFWTTRAMPASLMEIGSDGVQSINSSTTTWMPLRKS